MVVKQFVVNAGLKGKWRWWQGGEKLAQRRDDRTSTSGDEFRVSAKDRENERESEREPGRTREFTNFECVQMT